ncbi:MAG TPA: hypothetical protein PKD90_07565, partial [Phnomibacter sp.]|nr:hypothetical protein [Phnomibacter sp.]
TVAAAASIVVTAVYILRAIGKVLMGPVAEKAAFSITPAAWYEKLAACLLLAGILAMGLWPRLMQKMVTPGVQQLLQHTQIVQAP